MLSFVKLLKVDRGLKPDWPASWHKDLHCSALLCFKYELTVCHPQIHKDYADTHVSSQQHLLPNASWKSIWFSEIFGFWQAHVLYMTFLLVPTQPHYETLLLSWLEVRKLSPERLSISLEILSIVSGRMRSCVKEVIITILVFNIVV